jgi:hypothetical protein
LSSSIACTSSCCAGCKTSLWLQCNAAHCHVCSGHAVFTVSCGVTAPLLVRRCTVAQGQGCTCLSGRLMQLEHVFAVCRNAHPVSKVSRLVSLAVAAAWRALNLAQVPSRCQGMHLSDAHAGAVVVQQRHLYRFCISPWLLHRAVCWDPYLHA